GGGVGSRDAGGCPSASVPPRSRAAHLAVLGRNGVGGVRTSSPPGGTRRVGARQPDGKNWHDGYRPRCPREFTRSTRTTVTPAAGWHRRGPPGVSETKRCDGFPGSS